MVLSGAARAQLLDRYYPANVPAYQDWATAAAGAPTDLGYAPLGIRLGSFIISRGPDEEIGYATAPFGAAQGASVVEETAGEIAVNSDWTRNRVNAAVQLANTQYPGIGKATTDWTASLGGVFMVAADTIELGYAHIHAVGLPTELGAFAQAQPVTEQEDDFRGSYTVGRGRISLVPAVQADLIRFGSISGGKAAAQADLFGRNAVTLSLTGNYEFAGGHNVLAIVCDSRVQYGGARTSRPADYDDVSVLVGVEYRASAVLSYRLLAGYETRVPTRSGTEGDWLSAPAAEADVLWSPTVLTTVTGKISQNFENSPTGGGQGINATSVQLDLDHMLTRAIDLHAAAQFIRGAFAHGGAEDQWQTTLRASWHASRHLVLSAEYDFSDAQGGGGLSPDYQNQSVVVRGRLQW